MTRVILDQSARKARKAYKESKESKDQPERVALLVTPAPLVLLDHKARRVTRGILGQQELLDHKVYKDQLVILVPLD